MLEKKEMFFRIMDACCLGQFIIAFLYVNLFVRPVTRGHMIFVGVSAAFGLILSAAARTLYDMVYEQWDYRHVSDETKKMIDDVEKMKKK